MENKCPTAKKCGACQLSNMDYERQLRFKQANSVKLLGRFCRVDDIVGMEDPYHYRNKAQFAVRRAQNGRIITGVYQSSSGGIAVTDGCMLNDEKANLIVKFLRKKLDLLGVRPYDARGGKGVLRHIMIRGARSTGEYMVVFVCFDDDLKRENELISSLQSRFPEVKTAVLNVSKSAKMTLGSRERVLFGSGYIEDVLCGRRFRISPRSFYQINSVQTEILYNTAIDFAALTGNERILDAYCGTGTIGIAASGKCASIVGVELNADAVNDARINASVNNVGNAEYINDDASAFMRRAAENGESFDVVFTDPPRAGCSREFLSSLVKLSPKTVVYISCDQQTLARDLYFLVKNGYKVRKIRPVDMFPQTRHIETVIKLTRL